MIGRTRQAFEDWARASIASATLRGHYATGGHWVYHEGPTRLAWAAWRAAWAIGRQDLINERHPLDPLD